MGFYDYKGYWRNDGDGYYDAKGYFRGPNDGFYDSKGYYRSPGEGYYDAKGYFRSASDGYYDAKGNYRSAKVEYGMQEVNESGNWLGGVMGVVLLVPIAIVWIMLITVVEWIASNLYVVFGGYIVLTVILCLLTTRMKKHRGAKFALNFVGNFMCILSFIYVALIYAVPYVLVNGSNFASIFEFILVLAFVAGGVAVIQFFNYYHEKAILEFILGIIFFTIVIILLKNGSKEIDTIETFIQMYNLKMAGVCKLLFGFAI